jgi:hypothetical protein
MVEDEEIKEDKFEFDAAGEALAYISLEQARVVAMRTARDEPGDYGQGLSGVRMVYQPVEQEEGEDYYVVTMSFRPEGDFVGSPGQEQFFIEKEGAVAYRQVLSLPRSTGRRRIPAIPVAIGLAVVIVAAGIVFAADWLGSRRDREVGGSTLAPASTPQLSVSTPQALTLPPIPTTVPAVPDRQPPLKPVPIATSTPKTPVIPPSTLVPAVVPPPASVPAPAGPPSGPTWISLSAGSRYTCGVTTEGTAYCWGDGEYGRLGYGAEAGRPTPVQVSGDLSWTSISAGSRHTCGVGVHGAVYCWGSGASGRLGNGDIANQLTPAPVTGGLSFLSVSASGGHTCGITTQRLAYCWGRSPGLGNGPAGDSTTPVPVSGDLAFNLLSAKSHTCGITVQGVAYCWGGGSNGELGNGSTENSAIPVPVSGGLAFISLATGHDHTCGRRVELQVHRSRGR